jgi:chaperonin GroES
MEVSAVKIRPLQDRVLIKRLDQETTSPGGIVIPDTAAEKPIMGEVVAAGAGKRLDNGEVRKLAVSVGDRVLFGKFSGTEVKLDNVDYLVMREDDIMGIVEK